ncbi:MarR family transcriptional regulator [Methanosarcina sp. KYL-1]|uniref:MarR family winged helix-turn-helix transcriptional regulator n=1 Tax=Methanosarcina sp. KYL-1 TaxID=2602068 RepID=UPI002100FEEB|nr:MarR family transcriptional regulator [Methanosarcina sp. KYL-1]MCQ1536624.1 MarR family transcriptional regulator [Methanosarcina sp. KYL-1]
MEDPRAICGPIAHIYRSHLAYMVKELEPYGIGSGQFDFLMVLYRRDGISQETLAKALKVSKATSTRAVQSLEKEGYVYRQVDEDDRRAYKVYLTEKGKEMRGVVLEKLVAFVDTLLSDFTSEEKEDFRQLLQKASRKLFEPCFEPPELATQEPVDEPADQERNPGRGEGRVQARESAELQNRDEDSKE